MKIAQLGEPILKTPAINVAASELLTQQFVDFVQAMLQAIQQAGGIGIAAPQVFDPRAIMIIASRPTPRYPNAAEMAPLIMLNPKVLAASDELVSGWEGCLSVPGVRGNVKRHEWIEVEYLSMQGDVTKRLFEGFIARIFQHEYDHLIGKTWLDHIENMNDIVAESFLANSAE